MSLPFFTVGHSTHSLEEFAALLQEAGVERVVLPKANREDLYDVPADIKGALKIDFAETVDDVLHVALTMHPHGAEPRLNLPGLDMTHEAVRH